MFSYLFIFILSICLTYSLKCPEKCELHVKFNDLLPSDEDWLFGCGAETDEVHTGYCVAVVVVNYMSQEVSLDLFATNDTDVHSKEVTNSFDSVHKLSDLEFGMRLQLPRALYVIQITLCRNSDFCSINEARHIYTKLATMTGRSLTIIEHFQILLELSSTTGALSCFDSKSNVTVQCTNSHDAICRTTRKDITSPVVASCASAKEKPTVEAFYYSINSPHNVDKLYRWIIECNRDNCNGQESFTKMLNLIQSFIQVSSNGGGISSGSQSTRIQASLINIVLLRCIYQFFY